MLAVNYTNLRENMKNYMDKVIVFLLCILQP